MNRKRILIIVILFLTLAAGATGYYYVSGDKCGGGIKSIFGFQDKYECAKPINENQQKDKTADLNLLNKN